MFLWQYYKINLKSAISVTSVSSGTQCKKVSINENLCHVRENVFLLVEFYMYYNISSY